MPFLLVPFRTTESEENKTVKRRTKRTTARKSQGRKKRAVPKKRGAKAPRTAKQYFSKSRQFRQTWDSVAHTISKMRSGGRWVSLRKAAWEFGIDPDVVLKLGRSALRKQKNGKYVAKKADNLLRVLGVLTPDGRQELAVRDSRLATLVGKHWDAVQRYLQTGDSSALKKLAGKKIKDASRKKFVLLTDTEILNRLASAGVLSFETLYAGHS